MGFITNTTAIEFLKKPIVGDDIKRFTKIHDDHVNLFFVIKGVSQILNSENYLGFGRMLWPKTMLFICKNWVVIKMMHNIWMNDVL